MNATSPLLLACLILVVLALLVGEWWVERHTDRDWFDHSYERFADEMRRRR